MHQPSRAHLDSPHRLCGRFTNKSDDIRRICADALTKVGVEWKTTARGSDPYNLSIARRASVALMDAHVGPKY